MRSDERKTAADVTPANPSPTMSRRTALAALPAMLLVPRALAASAADAPARAQAPAQAGDQMLRLRGFNHVTLSVSDVNRSVDFYQGLFGMPVISRQGATVNLQIGAGPQFVSITPANGAAPSAERARSRGRGFQSRIAR